MNTQIFHLNTGLSKKKFIMWSKEKVVENSKIVFDGVFLSI